MMCADPLITIVVPIYNVEEYLKRCLDSIKNQTYKNIEAILVDDGSKDSSGKIAEEYASLDQRFVVVHKKNGGLSDARNAGIKVAKGKYVTFVDSDDYISHDCIEFLYNLLKNNKADLSIADFIPTEKSDDNSRIDNPYTLVMSKQDAFNYMFYGKVFTHSATVKLYPLEYFTDIQYPVGKFAEDLFTTYKTILKANKIVYSNQIVEYYFQRADSLMHQKRTNLKMDLDTIEALRNIKNDVPISTYGLDKSFSSLVVSTVLGAILRAPSIKEIMQYGLMDIVKKYRSNVLQDKKALKSVRLCSFCSYFGIRFTLTVFNVYYKLKSMF